MSARTLAILVLLGSAMVAAPTMAQEPTGFFQFGLDVPNQGSIDVPINSAATMVIVVHDLSKDSPGGLQPGLPTIGLPHQLNFAVEAVEPDGAWSAQVTPPTGSTTAGDQIEVSIQFSVTGAARSPYYLVNFSVTASNADGSTYHETVPLKAHTPGIPLFTVTGAGYQQVPPRGIWDAELRVSNNDLVPRSFETKVIDNPCGVGVGLPSTFVVPAKTFQYRETISMAAPQITSIFGVGCQVGVQVRLVGGDIAYTQYYTVYVQGVNYDVPTIFWTLVLIVALILLFLFARRRKERIEEEILGKPQKPWTIPVERVYLKHLKAKDERAAYVVRHYLMEDEYRSSLLWYKSYKKATKDTRKRERHVLSEEKAYARWKAREEAKVARPLKLADKYEAALQRKLDRKARRGHRKALARWRGDVKKLEAVHAKETERALERQAKAERKAAKKGLPAPPPMQVAAPDLPAEPQPTAMPLAGHRWAKKAARYRARMERKQGDLEVKLEKADARRQAKVERRVGKYTRGLDDAEFVAEHSARPKGGRSGGRSA